ncbi:flagellin [Microvirga sp. CF3062]|uniref:flagellin n=1 Tax=Microvirga sp. CF3062 TaxID=3110182 RepID=UPI002E782168|nr:flagellin [Microvirga sp. CF3062]MEE1655396.1 flagellin [Microvirga sp. CF3062]
MSSINTNLSAMTALQSLKSTQTAMNKTQNQISSGLRVGEASHNASYWSIATQMKSDNGALGSVKDSIKQSKSMIDTFSSAMDKALVHLNEMKKKVATGGNPGADLGAIQTELNQRIAGLKSTADSATINGQNWLKGNPQSVQLVTSYDNGVLGKLAIDTAGVQLFQNATAGTGGLLANVASINVAAAPSASYVDFDTSVGGAVSTLDAATAGTLTVQFGTGATATAASVTFVAGEAKTINDVVNKINGDAKMSALVSAQVVDGNLRLVSKLDGQSMDNATTIADATLAADLGKIGSTAAAGSGSGTSVDTALANIERAIEAVTKGSSMLGATKALLETQEEFIGVLSDSLTAGVSAYVDADMNEASTRYQALQTQQQLGVQALSMANQNSQMILKLFQ